MTSEFFNLSNYQKITSQEYELYKKSLNTEVFSRFYKQGTSQNLINSSSNIPFRTNIKNEYQILPNQEIFLNYQFSILQKERLMTYFGKNLIEEKLNSKNEYFKNVLDQIEVINSLIAPIFKELEIDYELHLTGGALRDHILDKTNQVKDLDIVIEFSDRLKIEKMKPPFGSDKYQEQKKELDKFFKDKESVIEKYDLKINFGQSREKILHEIVYQTVNKLKSTEVKSFSFWGDESSSNKNEKESIKEPLVANVQALKPEDLDDTLIYDGLFSVIKISGKNFKYPMDLLLNSNRHTYLSSFDFDICKCSYTVKQLEINKEVDRLYLYDGFIKDIIDETLSLNSQIFNEEKQVDRCLKDHYIRLKNKYPEYKINILSSNIINEKLMNYIQKAHSYYLMESKLIPKDNGKNIKKIKI